MKSPDVAVYQVPWEFDRLLEVLPLSFGRVLEVGCYEGGTLWHWITNAETVVAIDDQCRNSDEWHKWAVQYNTTLHVLPGSSHDPVVIHGAECFGPYDMVFIDADHSYDAVHADWINYKPMVAEGGMLVFHDILPRPGYGVSEVWAKVKAQPGARWIEIGQEDVEPGNEGRCGIGVLWT